ncbi:MAG: hypothetical protein LBE27_06230 [Deltaproteobacteria bacterium]|jgi:hypothetical protein|nr:hypothetical protein [Deltaproteobacteria bacterium]
MFFKESKKPWLFSAKTSITPYKVSRALLVVVLAVLLLTVIQGILHSGRYDGYRFSGESLLGGFLTKDSSQLAAIFSREDSSEKNDPRSSGEFKREARLRKLAEATAEDKDVQTDFNLYSPLEPKPVSFPRLPIILAKVAVSLASAAVLAMLVLIGIKAWKSWKMKDSKAIEKKDKSKEEDKETEERIQKALKDVEGDADKLAQSGRYTEAMHTLLLEGIEQFKRRDTATVPATYTARELLWALPLSKDENEAFTDLVIKVEPTWFGPMEGTDSDYRGARASFQRLLGKTEGALAP